MRRLAILIVLLLAFMAGCATGMKPIRNCLIDAASMAARMAIVLNKKGA